jgi:hypothetical protein
VTRSRERQKQDELEQFQRFAAVCAVVPRCPPRQPKEPEPDIVLDCSGGRIGIELTDLLPSGNAPDRGRESERVNLLEHAKQLYERNGYPPANVYVAWSAEPRIRKQLRAAQAHLLSELVAKNYIPGIYGIEVGSGFERIREDLPVTHLHILPAATHRESDWREGEFHEVAPLAVGDLRDRIRQEGFKRRRYREAYAQVWLLLVIDAAGPSTWGVILNDVWESTFESCYNRVFIFDFARDRYGELRLSVTDEFETVHSA